MFEIDSAKWAALVFGKAQLKDPRRTKRLVNIATSMADNAGKSLVNSCPDPASIEGAYRFIRNDHINDEDIAEAGYLHTDAIVKQRPLVLALQDTTGLSYKHSVCQELGAVNSASSEKRSPKGRTLYAHSTLMLDAHEEKVIGLAYQHYWYREKKQIGKQHTLQCRERELKESYKWQNNVEEIAQRLGDLSNVIDVCDREADIYEYLDYQQSAGHRFVVRAKGNRRLLGEHPKLEDALAQLKPAGKYTIDIQQKGGRKARTATIALSYTQVILKKPQRAKGAEGLPLNIVVCTEVNNDTKSKLQWLLYTTEQVTNADEARAISRYYELRWRIEEFHKIWKSEGTEVEKLRMQHIDNLKKAAVIQAFIAVRLFQLRELAQNKEAAEGICCTTYLNEISWKLLFKATATGKPIPTEPPSLKWAYYALARLGRWYDSKRTGRVGTKAMWDGWVRLMWLVESYAFMKELDL
ncbi:IS4 family transposase [Colwellia sp. M166]|uniref:IS4 family transposase n=1 Tax=Colwellia sp. M166 TaxID=2583805 RepID=UPI00211E21A2|nr:IS4 family transposase [Colwellia sp. M166]UUO22877.1 IS4 family transposase [Colwellia sp. M166]